MKVIGLMTDFELSRNIVKMHDKVSMFGDAMISRDSDEAYREKHASSLGKLKALKDHVALHRPDLIHGLRRNGFW